jgi:hypothetical protein
MWHIIHGEVEMGATSFLDSPSGRPAKVQCIVVHNARALLDGVKKVHVYLNSWSERSKAMGLQVHCINLVTEEGAEFNFLILPEVISGDFTISLEGQDFHSFIRRLDEEGELMEIWPRSKG